MIFQFTELFKSRRKPASRNVWTRKGTLVTFRAELMPSLDAERRTFQVAEVLKNGRVKLVGFQGEFSRNGFAVR